MKSETLTRYHLVSDKSRLNVLLDRDDLRVGSSVTLKDGPDPERVWTVQARFETLERKTINRGWNNNI